MHHAFLEYTRDCVINRPGRGTNRELLREDGEVILTTDNKAVEISSIYMTVDVLNQCRRWNKTVKENVNNP